MHFPKVFLAGAEMRWTEFEERRRIQMTPELLTALLSQTIEQAFAEPSFDPEGGV